MNYYKKNRKKAGLSEVVVAKKLGLKPTQYMAIERGVMKMPTDCIDKFQKIIKEDNAINVESKFDEDKINVWFLDVCRLENGKRKLDELMHDFNINKYMDLSILLGYKSPSVCSQYFRNNGEDAGFEFRERLYDFFHDNKNIQIPGKEINPFNNFTKDEKETELKINKWFNNLDINDYLKVNNISARMFAKEVGVDSSTVYNALRDKSRVSIKTKLSMKSVVDAHGYIVPMDDTDVEVNIVEDSVNKEVSNNSDEEVSIDSIIAEYVAIKEKISDNIHEIIGNICELEEEKERLANEKKQLEHDARQYEQFITDLTKLNK